VKRRLILQAIHPDYACPAFETMFETEQLEELRALLGPGGEDDPDFEKHYGLDPVDLRAICARFGIAFDAGEGEVFLYEYKRRDEFPYLLHTNYELALMLDGRKKFARMDYEYPPHQHPHEDRFDHYVMQGVLHKEVDIEPFGEPLWTGNGKVLEGVRTAYYTPKGEEWRIKAWRLVVRAWRKEGWNDTLERLEGMLYGYEDWQNDWYAEHRRKNLIRFGTFLVYVALTPSELAAVESSALRALPAIDRDLRVIGTSEEDLTVNERQQLLSEVAQGTLVRLRVKALPFLGLVADGRERVHSIRGDQIKDLNAALLENIEVIR
jgi:hypothetical protein